MPSRWMSRSSAALIATGALIASPLAVSASGNPAGPASPVVGHVAFVSASQAVRIVEIQADGTTSNFQTIGPVTAAAPGRRITVQDLMASADGNWVAWDEAITNGKGKHETFKNVLALRDIPGKMTYHLSTSKFPVGFAGSTLITNDGGVTQRTVVKPSLHFVTIPDKQYPLGTYAAGVVDSTYSTAPKGRNSTYGLRLTSLTGTHTTLHRYVRSPTNYRVPDAAYASSDGKHLVVELGNHQDFGGLGPSSLADEFSLGTTNTRHQLGHYGTASAAWRVASVSFAGASDSVWAAWERATKTGAAGVVSTFSDGNWQRVVNNGIAVAGNSAGYVIAQQGKFVSVGVDFPEFQTVPTTGAQLINGSTSIPLDIEGNAFVWVS